MNDSGTPSHVMYFSCDVETDGSVPGSASMSSIGMCVSGYDDGNGFVAVNPDEHGFYRELKPNCEYFDQEAITVSGLDRDALIAHGSEPAAAMHECAAWIQQIAGERAPVFVAYPLGFDWMWTHVYFMRYTGSSPFGHSRHYDMKTAFAVKAGVPVDSVGRNAFPAHLHSKREHTHNALDDARGQADLHANLMAWEGAPSTAQTHRT